MGAFLVGNWGNFVTILGFIVTILTLLRTKTAAVAAQQAAEDTKAQLSRVNTLGEFSSAIAIMDEIKRLHRAGAWELVPDRYSVLRRLLASVQTLNPDLTIEQKTVLGSAIVQFRTMENKVEAARHARRLSDLNLARFNRVVAKQLDELDKVMLSIRQAGI
jgi:hypothetical protein